MARDRESRGRHRIARAAGVAVLATSLVTGVAVSLGGGGAGLAVTAYSGAHASAAAPGRRMALMRAAARGVGVPVGPLLAIFYNESRGGRPGGSASRGRGLRLM